MEVCHPSPTYANGKPQNSVSRASTGKAYHHFVNTAKEITVSGKTIFSVNAFMVCLRGMFAHFFYMTSPGHDHFPGSNHFSRTINTIAINAGI